MGLSQDMLDFYTESFNQSTYKIPQPLKRRFETLYHTTSVESALALLKSGQASGDYGKHFNLSLYPNTQLAAEQGVCLEFRFTGIHRARMFGVGDKRPTHSKLYNNVIYHCFNGNADPMKEALKDWLMKPDAYWQSIVYPGTRGLVFARVERLSRKCDPTVFNAMLGKKIEIVGLESYRSFDSAQIPKGATIPSLSE